MSQERKTTRRVSPHSPGGEEYRRPRSLNLPAVLAFFAALAAAAYAVREAGTEFRVSVAADAGRETLTGRIFVLLDDDPDSDPLYSQKIILARDVRSHPAAVPVVIGRKSRGFPFKPAGLPPGRYTARAVADLNADHWDFTLAPGNLVGRKVVVSVGGGPVDLILERAVPEPSFNETDLKKEVRLESRLLTEFHGRRTVMEAAVVLPPSYLREPERRYPAVYVMPGYGASHYSISGGDLQQKRYGMNMFGMDKVFVFLELSCALGTHCFVDSENNGPWGRALVEEFIPFIEKGFRVIPRAEGRLLTGQSSGAWAALWLQAGRPDHFGGAWAVSPDPVDFRSFCGVDLYAPGANVFYETLPGGNRRLRPLIFSEGEPVLTWKDISDKEAVTGPGGFMETFEAQFSPRGKDGRPERMWDRRTGRVNASVVGHWRRYDVSRRLRENWTSLGPRLKGKLHVFVADDDDAQLDDPVRLLREELSKLDGEFATFKILESGGHGGGVWQQIVGEIHGQMDLRLKSAFPGLR